jgi:hypothetical protein
MINGAISLGSQINKKDILYFCVVTVPGTVSSKIMPNFVGFFLGLP